MISQIENPELKQDYLNKLKKNLIKDENVKKLKSTISFEETLERFNKKKSKDLTINDLQHEIIVVKQEIIIYIYNGVTKGQTFTWNVDLFINVITHFFYLHKCLYFFSFLFIFFFFGGNEDIRC